MVTISAFADASAATGSALLLEGVAGAGKTTLWLAGMELARSRCLRVLEARPVDAEAQMAFAALGDVLQDVLDEVLDGLAPPQAEALRVALLRERPRGAPPDERAVGLGLLNALRLLSARGPVLLALDDIQWLDRASAIVLAFAWRRLRDDPVRLLMTSRPGVPVPENLIESARTERIAVGPLSLGATHRLLYARLDLALTPPALRRVHEVAGGNPFFVLELGRALRAHPAHAPTEPLPVPDRLRQLLSDRLGSLSPATREAIAVAAAAVRPTRALIDGATGDDAALQSAFDSGVLVAVGEAVRFTHPLLASAAYEEQGPGARRALHARLADLVTDVEQRARHLALAATGEDESVADELDRAAAHARARGSTATAADLMEQSVRLTPRQHPHDRQRRTMSAGLFSFAAGDTARARRLLENAVADAPGGRDRAEGLTALGRLLLFEGDQPGAAEVCAEALEEPAADPSVRANAGGMLGSALLFMREDLVAASHHAAEAAELSRGTADRDLRVSTIATSALLQVVVGHPDAFGTLREAERLGEPSDDQPVIASPSFHRGVMLLWTDGAREAAPLFDALHARALANGDEASLPLILTETALAEYHNGDWPRAARLADDAHQLALQTGQRSQEAFALAAGALVCAVRGRADEAREHATAALAMAGDRSMAVAGIYAEWALALLDLSLGHPAPVADRLGALRRRQLAAGAGEPGVVPFLADEAEAAVALGRTAEAEAVLEWLEERGASLNRASALGAAARGRALLAGTRGDLADAVSSCERALAAYGRAMAPFETARTQLLLGALQRRAKQRSAAREALGRAQVTFERLGAGLWADRARAELARIGGRGRTAAGALTPAERRVAELVAEGRSNKEIAAALFVTPKTVETQLSRMYAKLGVHSRTALTRRLGNL